MKFQWTFKSYPQTVGGVGGNFWKFHVNLPKTFKSYPQTVGVVGGNFRKFHENLPKTFQSYLQTLARKLPPDLKSYPQIKVLTPLS